MSEQLVPEIRVAGFDGEWVDLPFNQMAHRRSSIVPAKGLPQLEYEDIESGFGRLNKDLRDKTSQKNGIRFERGDVLFGKLRPYLKNWFLPDFEGLAVGDFWVLAPDTCTGSYLYGLIQAPRFTVASSISSGSKMPRSDWPFVSHTSFASPVSREEQDSVGSTFLRLERLVNEHRQKHRQLQQAKASLMQRMFAAPGESEPEIRFEGFTGAWQELPLLDLIESIVDFRGRTPKKLGMNWAKSGHLALSANNVKPGYIDFHRDVHYGDEALYQNWMGGRELYEGQVLFTTEAPMGNVAQVPDNRGYILSQRVIAFVPNKNQLGDDFLRVLLESPPVVSQLNSLLSGGTAKGVSQKALSAVLIKVPQDLGEQRRVAALFLNLDLLTQAEAQYVSKLQQVKSALLQKMFV